MAKKPQCPPWTSTTNSLLRELEADCLIQSHISITEFKAVSDPTLKSVPGTLFETVAGKQIIGIAKAGYKCRFRASCVTEMKASNPPIIIKAEISNFWSWQAISPKSFSGKCRFVPSSEPPVLAQLSTSAQVRSFTSLPSKPWNPL